MKSKTFLITGANTGIGLSTAKVLAKEKDVSLFLLCRNQTRGEAACQVIQRVSGNNHVYCIQCNLASFDSIQKAVNTIRNHTHSVDLLLNNAGIAKSTFCLSQNQVELTFAVNYLGHFYLTLSLLDLLKNSPAARIVNVSSDSHRAAFKNFFSDINFEDRKYSSLRAYIQSKLANVLFTYSLAEKLKETPITVNVLDPGNVKTDIHREVHKLPLASRLIFKLVKPFFLNVEDGAKTSIYVSLSNELNDVSGHYFYKEKRGKSSRLSYNKPLQELLWKKSLALTQLEW